MERKYPVATLREVNRVLKPNSALLVDTIFSKSHEIGPIYLAEKASEISKKRFLNGHYLIDFIEKSDFANLYYLGRPNCSFFVKDNIPDIVEVILNSEWHNTYSSLKVKEQTGELEEVRELIRTKVTDGTIDELKSSFTRKQRTFGCHTTVFAQKISVRNEIHQNRNLNNNPVVNG